MEITGGILLVTNLMVLGKVKKLRIETNRATTRFSCTIDYHRTYHGNTIDQACKRAYEAWENLKQKEEEKKAASYGEAIIKEAEAEYLFK